jgi:GNAT superfamily N-acetyltransferase
MVLSQNKNLTIKVLEQSDISIMVEAFQKVNWRKPVSLFESYYLEQKQLERIIWLAYLEHQFAGYVTLKWKSRYESFAKQNIPEIMDLNVLPNFRKNGIGSALLNVAEEEAATKSDVIGIGVGLYGGLDGGYGAAQRLYIKRGYLPDGLGVTYRYKPAVPGQSYDLDDDLVLWLSKKLK